MEKKTEKKKTEQEIREKSIQRMRKVQDLLDHVEFEFEEYRKHQASLPTSTIADENAIINLRMSLRYLQLAIQEVLATTDSTNYVLTCLIEDVKPSAKPITYEELFGDSAKT
jgi:hypothetical protein